MAILLLLVSKNLELRYKAFITVHKAFPFLCIHVSMHGVWVRNRAENDGTIPIFNTWCIQADEEERVRPGAPPPPPPNVLGGLVGGKGGGLEVRLGRRVLNDL